MQRLRRLLGRRSARSGDGAFVVEGPTLVAEARDAGWLIEAQFASSAEHAVPAVEAPVFVLAPGVIERVASTHSPQPLLAVVRMPEPVVVAETATFVVAVDRVADPGNLGTIMRSACAAGADALVVTPGTVDPFSPKVVRSSAGAIFRLPIAEMSLEALRELCALSGRRFRATSSHHGTPYDNADLRAPFVLVMGNEAHGVDQDLVVDEWLTIPHVGPSESLNVAMAATVICFEVARQRRVVSGSVSAR